MRKKKHYRYFMNRADGWNNLFNDSLKLIFPKDKNGNWMHHNALSGAGWVEANAWQGTWGLSQAIPDLATRMGGNDSFCAKLNYDLGQSTACRW